MKLSYSSKRVSFCDLGIDQDHHVDELPDEVIQIASQLPQLQGRDF